MRPAGRRVHSGAPCDSLCSSLDVVFARVRPGGPLIHPGLLGSLVCSLRFVGFVGVVGFTRVRPGSRSVRLGSLGSLWCALRVVGIVCGRWIRWGRWVHSFVHWWSLVSSKFFGFTRVHSEGGWVHPWCLGSLGCAVGVVGFIRGG